MRTYGSQLKKRPSISTVIHHHERTSVVPQIYVESESTVDLTKVPTSPVRHRRTSTMSSAPSSPVAPKVSFEDMLQAPGTSSSPLSNVSPLGSAGPRQSVHWTTHEMPSPDYHNHHRLRTGSSVSTYDVMEAFQDSSWGVAMRRSISAVKRGSGDPQAND